MIGELGFGIADLKNYRGRTFEDLPPTRLLDHLITTPKPRVAEREGFEPTLPRSLGPWKALRFKGDYGSRGEDPFRVLLRLGAKQLAPAP